RFACGEEGAERRHGVSAHQPSARLPDLRPGRRMPAAGPRGGLRRQQLALHRREARGAEQGARPTGRRRGNEPLHPVHAMRVLPFENEAVNECWLSDKDRFSYEGLNSPDRLQRPMIKQDGQWHEVDWEQAFEYTIPRLKDFGMLASPHATLEELHLVSRLNVPADFRLRHSDFSAEGKRAGITWLGMSIEDVQTHDRVLVI